MHDIQSELGETKSFQSAAFSGEAGAGVIGVLFGMVLSFGLLVALFFFSFGKVVPPNFIGVRQNNFRIPGLLQKGYADKGLDPGLHWTFPGLSTIYLLPRDLQIVTLSRDGDGQGDLNLDQLEIPTTDGSKVRTDITLMIRYFPSVSETPVAKAGRKTESDVLVPMLVNVAHGGPRDLVNTYTTVNKKQLSTFAKKAEDFLKRSLSTLSTSDYYNPVLREKAAVQAQEKMNELVNQEGIEVWGTLIRRYVYSEKNIDDAIFAKNLQEQTERLNAAQSALAEAKAKTEETRASWDANIRVLKDQGAAKVRVLASEGNRYQQEKMAEGEKLVQIAIAAVEREKNNAFSSPGGDVFIARQMVPIVGTLTGGLVSDLDPYDLGAWIGKFKGMAAPSRTDRGQP